MAYDWQAPVSVTVGCYASTSDAENPNSTRFKDKYATWKMTLIPPLSGSTHVAVSCPKCEMEFAVEVVSRRSSIRFQMGLTMLLMLAASGVYLSLRGMSSSDTFQVVLLVWALLVLGLGIAGVIQMLLHPSLFGDPKLVRVTKDNSRDHILFLFDPP